MCILFKFLLHFNQLLHIKPLRYLATKVKTVHVYITLLNLLYWLHGLFFFNMFFLIIALSQFVPFLKVGFMFTYVAPLVFVLVVTMIKEAYDDF